MRLSVSGLYTLNVLICIMSCWVQITAKRLAVIFRVETGKLVGHIGAA